MPNSCARVSSGLSVSLSLLTPAEPLLAFFVLAPLPEQWLLTNFVLICSLPVSVVGRDSGSLDSVSLTWWKNLVKWNFLHTVHEWNGCCMMFTYLSTFCKLSLNFLFPISTKCFKYCKWEPCSSKCTSMQQGTYYSPPCWLSCLHYMQWEPLGSGYFVQPRGVVTYTTLQVNKLNCMQLL